MCRVNDQVVGNNGANKLTLALEALKEGLLELRVFELVKDVEPLLFCFREGDRARK